MNIEKTKYRIFKEILNNQTERFYPQVLDLDRNGWVFLHENKEGYLVQSSVKNSHFSDFAEAAKAIERYLDQRYQNWLEQVANSEYIELNEDILNNLSSSSVRKINSLENDQQNVRIKIA